ncbi:hypothetical protein BRADI_4g37866v3 [Brachypodium distachyon]|uniref:Uncharacterized protein n=1 Tax=Brachypodium distachyon TaxID=15368 RepID=A0A2K2CSY0_BRADI|nr:hypothetical protein BRADI_4g37866v3 [Brachypodium distachyon]
MLQVNDMVLNLYLSKKYGPFPSPRCLVACQTFHLFFVPRPSSLAWPHPASSVFPHAEFSFSLRASSSLSPLP